MEKLIPFEKIEKKWMKSESFRRECNRLEPEYQVLRAIIEHRIKTGMTQKQLAKLCKTKQSAISRFESGSYNPSLKFLQKIADGLGCELVLKFVPK